LNQAKPKKIKLSNKNLNFSKNFSRITQKKKS